MARNDPEPTAEEVEAMVAEQMQCLPSWWQSHVERQRLLDMHEPMCIMRSQGYSVADIVERFGVGEDYVYEVLCRRKKRERREQ